MSFIFYDLVYVKIFLIKKKIIIIVKMSITVLNVTCGIYFGEGKGILVFRIFLVNFSSGPIVKAC